MKIELIALDDAAMIEVAEHAAAANVVMVERAGQLAWAGREHIPSGWHVVGMGAKQKSQVPA